MNSHAPPNGKGASSNAPIRNFNLLHSYQRCSHSAKKIERMPPGHIHFAAEQCADCGRLLRWLPRPETIERQRLNAFRLARLAKFIRSRRRGRSLQQMRMEIHALRVVQAPLGFLFWVLEQRIARVGDEIERMRS